jgi:sugar lactone lactonase YvrE
MEVPNAKNEVSKNENEESNPEEKIGKIKVLLADGDLYIDQSEFEALKCSGYIKRLLSFMIKTGQAKDESCISEIKISDDLFLNNFWIIQYWLKKIYQQKNLKPELLKSYLEGLLNKQSEQELVEILNSADFFDVEPLKNACIEVIAEKLSMEDSTFNTEEDVICNPFIEKEIAQKLVRAIAHKNFNSFLKKQKLTKHTRPLAAFSPDGSLFVATSRDRSVCIYDCTDPKNITLTTQLTNHTDLIDSVVFSPDGTLLVTTSSYDHTVCIYDCTNPNNIILITQLTHHNDLIKSAAVFSPDGKLLVTASNDNTARIYDCTDPNNITLIIRLTDHRRRVTSAAFSPDGTLLVTISYDHTVCIYNCTDSNNITLITTLNDYADYVTSATFSPDGSLLVTASFDKTAYIYDLSEYIRFIQSVQSTDSIDQVLKKRKELKKIKEIEISESIKSKSIKNNCSLQ